MTSNDPAALSFGASLGDPAAIPSFVGGASAPAAPQAPPSGDASSDLVQQANTAFEQGNYKLAATQYLAVAEQLAAAGADPMQVGDAFWKAGRAQQFSTDFTESIISFGSAKEIFLKQKNETLASGADQEMQHSERENTVYEDADSNLRQDIQKAEVAGKAEDLGALHVKWAEFSMAAGAPYGALHHLNLAARVFGQANLAEGVAGAVFNAGMVLQGLQQFQAAFECLQHARNIYHDAGKTDGVHLCQFVMGQVGMATGQFPLAAQIFTDLEDEIKDSAEVLNVANTRAQLAQIYTVMGEDDKANEKLDLALKTYTLLGKQENIDEITGVIENLKVARTQAPEQGGTQQTQ
ncbi:hypothetical protein JT358_12560 [Micrococcales bacterium 31B]|nr:hypothetical protein [Micrococcales bacterium 31B]